MTSAVTISCILNTTDPTAALGFEAWIDDNKFFDTDHVQAQQKLSVLLDDADGEHELKFILKNKTSDLTQIDEAGNIVSDARLILNNLELDEITLGQIVVDNAVYTHNFNGTRPEIQENFYGEIGCNGTVSLKFTTPVYLWLLENY